MATNNLIPYKGTHPGGMLNDELCARGISQKDFAKQIGMPNTMLNELIKGKRTLTAETAMSLEAALDIDAKFWLAFQSQYDLDIANIQQKNIQRIKDISVWKVIKENIPVSFFEKMNVFTSSINDNIQKIWNIYGCDNIDELLNFSATQKSYFKKSEKLKHDTVNIAGWCQLVKYIAKDIRLENSFQLNSKENLITELKESYLTGKDLKEKTKLILNNYGIKFVILPKPDKAPIDGYSFMSGNNPVIAITLRKNTIDNFVFAIFHEICHIYNHLVSNNLDLSFLNIEDFDLSLKENEANNFARNALIPEKEWIKFNHENPCVNYLYFDKKITTFASRVGVHPSIVFGRYCFETSQYRIRTKIDRKI